MNGQNLETYLKNESEIEVESESESYLVGTDIKEAACGVIASCGESVTVGEKLKIKKKRKNLYYFVKFFCSYVSFTT